MHYLHESVKESVIRFYREPNGFDKRLPYKASVTVDYLSPKHASLSNMSGVINREMINSLKQHLKDNGVLSITFERHGMIRTENL